ncbi:MAG: galactokinase [Verrucomicrobia bacterium]|nr:galactokinase [Verrucomicrobiota bacterium]
MHNRVVAFAPGRVEILGNHTDYNEGVVLSAAIDCGVTASVHRLPQRQIEVSSQTNQRTAVAHLDELSPSAAEPWANYCFGVVRELMAVGWPAHGLGIEIASDLPVGAGLSSSAALEVATAFAAIDLANWSLAPMKIAQLCQKAENEFVGVKCGLLDQASSVFGADNRAILLDFRSITAETCQLPAGVSLLLLNSGIPHALTGGEYNERREQCQTAAAALKVTALRDATTNQVENSDLDPLVKRRALHITGENERVFAGREALLAGDVDTFGELMFASHESSRHNFENSTPNLDALVEIAQSTNGVIGSRLTGGGFGGSTVSLIRSELAQEIIDSMQSKYFSATGAQCSAILTRPSQGARVLRRD